MGLTSAWYGDYSGNVVPFNLGGGREYTKRISKNKTGDNVVDISEYSSNCIILVFSVTSQVFTLRFGHIINDTLTVLCAYTNRDNTSHITTFDYDSSTKTFSYGPGASAWSLYFYLYA